MMENKTPSKTVSVMKTAFESEFDLGGRQLMLVVVLKTATEARA